MDDDEIQRLRRQLEAAALDTPPPPAEAIPMLTEIVGATEQPLGSASADGSLRPDIEAALERALDTLFDDPRLLDALLHDAISAATRDLAAALETRLTDTLRDGLRARLEAELRAELGSELPDAVRTPAER
jgi:hypothetical protein